MRFPEVMDGDVFIHAGDILLDGTLRELVVALNWLHSLPHPEKILVAGNHDAIFEREHFLVKTLVEQDGRTKYLRDSHTVLSNGMKVWGSPWTPEFGYWSFMLPRGEKLRAVWSLIPDDTDILITHGPPAGILDKTRDNLCVGCVDLLMRVREIKPPYHIFGHIHPGHGLHMAEGTVFINPAICDDYLVPVYSPIVLEHIEPQRASVEWKESIDVVQRRDLED